MRKSELPIRKDRHGKYWARVRWGSNYNEKEKAIPLYTKSKVVARERAVEILRKRQDIIDGKADLECFMILKTLINQGFY